MSEKFTGKLMQHGVRVSVGGKSRQQSLGWMTSDAVAPGCCQGSGSTQDCTCHALQYLGAASVQRVTWTSGKSSVQVTMDAAIERLEPIQAEITVSKCRKNALQFQPQVFRELFSMYVSENMNPYMRRR